MAAYPGGRYPRRMLRYAALLSVCVLALTGCSAPQPTALTECLRDINEHVGASDATVTETVASPAGAYDWRGSVADDTFACASPDGSLLTTATVYRSDGVIERVAWVEVTLERD